MAEKMEEITRLARELGKVIAVNPRLEALLAARDAVQADPEARKTMQEYQEQVEKIRRLGAEQKPVEVADKHELARREQAIASNEKVKQLTKAQVDYSDLMRQMNDAIFSEIAAAEKARKTT